MENQPEKPRVSELTILYRVDCIPCGAFLGEVERNHIQGLIDTHRKNTTKPHNIISPFSRYIKKSQTTDKP